MSSTPEWIEFFELAGIASELALRYAECFSCNRMTTEMLDELDKGILFELGVSAIGDQLSILRCVRERRKELHHESRCSCAPRIQLKSINDVRQEASTSASTTFSYASPVANTERLTRQEELQYALAMDDSDEEGSVAWSGEDLSADTEQVGTRLAKSSAKNLLKGARKERVATPALPTLNEKLRSLSLNDILSGAKSKSILERLNNGESFDFDPVARNRFKRRVGCALLEYCDRRFAPRPDEVRQFFAHICSPFPSIEKSIYVGECSSILFQFIYNKKRLLKEDGLYRSRPYRKKRRFEEAIPLEQQADLNEELQSSVDPQTAEHLLNATRQFRSKMISEKGVACAFDAIAQLHNPSVILRDFQASESVDVAAFFQRWDKLKAAVLSLAECAPEDGRRQTWESFVTLKGEDADTHATLLRIMMLLRDQDSRKRISRLRRIYIEMMDQPDASNVASELMRLAVETGGRNKKKRMAATQPIVVRYGGSRTQFGVFVQANEIVCSEGLLHAVVVSLAAHYVFHLQFDAEVTDVWLVLLHFLGLSTREMKSNVGKRVAQAITAKVSQL